MKNMRTEWLSTMPLKTMIEKSIPPAKWLSFEVAPRKGNTPPVTRSIKCETAMSLAFQRALKGGR